MPLNMVLRYYIIANKQQLSGYMPNIIKKLQVLTVNKKNQSLKKNLCKICSRTTWHIFMDGLLYLLVGKKKFLLEMRDPNIDVG